jgi:FkbM family methyltransferase
MVRSLKNLLKGWIYRRAGVPFNPYSVPYALGKHLKLREPISLIDVGAHRGEFTRSLSAMCGITRGVLVEPQPDKAALLRRLFTAPRFQVVEAALNDRPGEVELEINAFDATTSILKTRRDLPELRGLDVSVGAKIKCRTLTLDVVYADNGFEQLDLLKLDVQGAEHLVIRGGVESLANTRMVWTEVSFESLYENSCLYHEIFDTLKAAGFGLFELEPGFRSPEGKLVQADALFIRL